MSPHERWLGTAVAVIAGTLAAELVVYLGVLLACNAGGQPAQQISCRWPEPLGAMLPGYDRGGSSNALTLSSFAIPAPSSSCASAHFGMPCDRRRQVTTDRKPQRT